MQIKICIGSSCHLKGSKTIIDGLGNLIEKEGLQDNVFLTGSFCTGNCTQGVSVLVDDKLYSVCPDTMSGFFEKAILKKFKAGEN